MRGGGGARGGVGVGVGRDAGRGGGVGVGWRGCGGGRRSGGGGERVGRQGEGVGGAGGEFFAAAHALHPAVVRGEGRADRGVGAVGDAVVGAGGGDDGGDVGVVHMADLGKKVVLDLEVEAAEVPGGEAVVGGEVDGGLDLVGGPVEGDFVGGGHDEGGFFDAVGELEDGGEHDPEEELGDEVEDERGGEAVHGDGDHEGPGEEEDLADDEFGAVASAGAGEVGAADLAGAELGEVVEEVPLHRDHAIERPHVEVLPAVQGDVGLAGGHAEEPAGFEVVVGSDDVGVAVVDVVVLLAPDVGAGAEQVDDEAHGVVGGFAVAIGAVVAVVHDREAEAGEHEAEGDGEEGGEREAAAKCEEEAVEGGKARKNGCGLGPHGPATGGGAAGEVGVDALAHVAVEVGATAQTDSVVLHGEVLEALGGQFVLADN